MLLKAAGRRTERRVNGTDLGAKAHRGARGTDILVIYGGGGTQTGSGLCHLKPFIWCLSSGLGRASDGCPVVIPVEAASAGSSGGPGRKRATMEQLFCPGTGDGDRELSVAAAPWAAAPDSY